MESFCSPLFPSSSNTPREWITSQHNITTTATPHQYIHMLHTHDSLYRDHLLVSHIVHVPSLTTLQSTCSHTALYQRPESKAPPPKTLSSQDPKDHNPNWGQKPRQCESFSKHRPSGFLAWQSSPIIFSPSGMPQHFGGERWEGAKMLRF